MQARTWRSTLGAFAMLGAISCGDAGDGSTAATTTAATTTSAPATTTVPTTTVSPTTTTAPCSATGLSPIVDAQSGLPVVVATMRADLARAAATCDWTALAALADRNGAGVRFSFGGPGDPIAYWRRIEMSGERPAPMRALRALLGLPFATQDLSPTSVQYLWPAAHVANPPSAAQLQGIADTGLYPLATLQEWVRTGNNYLGYRLAVTASGDWTFFLAGD